jgi:hypothetical protein
MTNEEIELSPVFIAASVAEVTFAEELLTAEAIEYEVRPEPYLRATFGGVCLQGLLFEVRAGQAEYCRRLFKDRGLERGVIEPPPNQP